MFKLNSEAVEFKYFFLCRVILVLLPLQKCCSEVFINAAMNFPYYLITIYRYTVYLVNKTSPWRVLINRALQKRKHLHSAWSTLWKLLWSALERDLMAFTFQMIMKLLDTLILWKHFVEILWKSFSTGCFIWHCCFQKSNWLLSLRPNQSAGSRGFFWKHFGETLR